MTTVRNTTLPDILPLPVSSWVVPVWPRYVFKMPGQCRGAQCPHCGSYVLWENLESHILEAREFLIDRGLKTLSVNAFLSSKEDSYPCILCAESHKHSLEVLAWISFFSRNFSWGFDRREDPTLTGEGKPTSKHLILPCFLCRRDPVNVGLSGNFLETAGTYHECQHGYWTLVLKF